jgi:HNH endonuclease
MRARGRCEYCRLPQSAYKRRFHLEHITARCHGGTEDLSNLALACGGCNLRKGVNLAGIDPQTGDVAVLFHPRKDAWDDHFEIRSIRQQGALEICGKTQQGRALVCIPSA